MCNFRSVNKWLILGIFLVGVFGIFTFCLGEDSFIVPHDQFDGSVFAYILRVNNKGMDTFEAIMNGLPKEGLQMEAPGLMIFYLLFDSSVAYICTVIFVMLIAFMGMYLLLSSLDVRLWVAFLIAFLFASLPFYPVYCLNIMGLPLFIYLGLIWKKDQLDNIVYVIICIDALIYGLFSSLVLCGYAVLVSLALSWLYLRIRKRAQWFRIRLVILASVLLAVYCLNNFDLILQVLGQESYISHRSEYVLNPETFSLKRILDFWKEGQYHAVSNHYYLLIFIIFAAILYVIKFRKLHENKKATYMFYIVIGTLMSSFFIAVFYGWFHSQLGIQLRSYLPGSLKSFQIDRFYWFYPVIWYAGAGAAAELLFILGEGWWKKLCVCTVLAVALLTLNKSASSNILYLNIKNEVAVKLNRQEYDVLPTFTSFFAEDVFKDIKRDIGKEQDTYRVVSIGLYPTVALYNGFYCLDGYSNNYPLEYKHEFYEVIRDELKKDEALKTYFCNWGNRCYAFSHEIGTNYMIPKESGLVINDLCFDIEKLKEMGCGYIFSAVEIEDEEQYGIRYLDNYSSESSYYRVWVYQL